MLPYPHALDQSVHDHWARAHLGDITQAKDAPITDVSDGYCGHVSSLIDHVRAEAIYRLDQNAQLDWEDADSWRREKSGAVLLHGCHEIIVFRAAGQHLGRWVKQMDRPLICRQAIDGIEDSGDDAARRQRMCRPRVQGFAFSSSEQR